MPQPEFGDPISPDDIIPVQYKSNSRIQQIATHLQGAGFPITQTGRHGLANVHAGEYVGGFNMRGEVINDYKMPRGVKDLIVQISKSVAELFPDTRNYSTPEIVQEIDQQIQAYQVSHELGETHNE